MSKAKRAVSLLLALFLLFGSYPAIASAKALENPLSENGNAHIVDMLDFEAEGGVKVGVDDRVQVWQTFTPGMDGILSEVSLLLKKYNSCFDGSIEPKGVVVQVKAVGSDSLPTGNVLQEVSVPKDQIADMTELQVPLTVPVEKGKQYAVLLSGLDKADLNPESEYYLWMKGKNPGEEAAGSKLNSGEYVKQPDYGCMSLKATVTPPQEEAYQIRVDGEILSGFHSSIADYWVYLPQGAGIPSVSLTDADGAALPDAQLTQASQIPDLAAVSYQGSSYRVHFAYDGDWREIKSTPYDGDMQGVPERPYLHDYSQTLTMKLYLATPIDKDNSAVRLRFDEALDLIKQIDGLTVGIPKIIYLVGWNYMGHDDRYPAWNVVNPNLCWSGSTDAAGDLNRLIREARGYNTTVSLHLNSTDAYEDSPLWDLYTKNDLICKRDGEYLISGSYNGKDCYKIVYQNAWNSGIYKKQVDDLLSMLPELKLSGTIHSDAFSCRVSDQSTLEEEQAARRQMIRYWRDCGIDLTSEHMFSSLPGDEEDSKNGNSVESTGLVGLIPYTWRLTQSDELWFNRPSSLLTHGTFPKDGGRIDDETAFLYGCSMHGEELFSKEGIEGAAPGWDVKFINQFCLQTLCYTYLNQFGNVSISGAPGSRTLLKEENVAVRYSEDVDKRCIWKDGFLLRRGNDVFIPLSWEKDFPAVIAYSEEGYTGREWTFLPDWEGVDSVDIYRMSKSGMQLLSSKVPIGSERKIALTLAPNQGVVILPSSRTFVTTFVVDGVSTQVKTEEENDIQMPKAPQKDGYVFMGWYTAAQGGEQVTIFNRTQTVYAQFSKLYSVTVIGGSADKTLAAAGERVTVTAAVPKGTRFTRWACEGVIFENPSDKTTAFSMPPKDVAIKAEYAPDTGETVIKLQSDTVERGDSIQFTAVGRGMDNTAPNNGDERDLPLTWSAGSFGSFSSDGPFAASFSTADMQPGGYTLRVTYQPQRFCDNIWVNAGDVVERTVTFTIKEKSTPPNQNEKPPAGGDGPATGEKAPLLPCVALLAAGTLLICNRRHLKKVKSN